MNYGYMVIYQQRNGNLLYRACKTSPKYEVGQQTSMGWKVVDIKRLHNGKCYSRFEYNNKLRSKRRISDLFKYIDTNLVYKVIILILITLLYIFR